jgi:signal transduction histidine kinase
MWVEIRRVYLRRVSRTAAHAPTSGVPTLVLAALCLSLVWDAWAGGGWLDGPFVAAPALASLWLGSRGRTAPTALACAAGALVLTVANQRAHPGDYSAANDLAFFLVLLGGPALLGLLLGQRTRRARELRELTERRAELLASEVRAARLEEQSRVAARVQHGVIQAMGAIVLRAGGAAQSQDPEAMRHALDDIESSARAALDALREHVGMLRESEPEQPPEQPPAAEGSGPGRSLVGPRDLGVAVALTLPLAVECVVGGHARGPAGLNVAAVLLLGSALALLRSRPLPATAAYVVIATATSHWLTPLPATVSVLPSILLLGYALGEQLGRRRDQLLGLGLLAAGLAAIWRAAADRPGVGGVAPGVVVASLAWLGGVVAADRAARVRRLDLLLADLGRRRAVAVRLATAEQRFSLARDLHDSVAAAMTVVCLHAAGVLRQPSAGVADLTTTLRTIDHTARSGLSELRSSLDVLDGVDAEALSLTRVLSDARTAGLEVRCADGTPRTLPPEADRALARVLREALVNAARHAPGSTVSVRLEERHDQLVLEVTDEGAIEPVTSACGTGHGMAGLRERLELDGGTLTYGPGKRGFRVVAALPLGSAAST